MIDTDKFTNKLVQLEEHQDTDMPICAECEMPILGVPHFVEDKLGRQLALCGSCYWTLDWNS